MFEQALGSAAGQAFKTVTHARFYSELNPEAFPTKHFGLPCHGSAPAGVKFADVHVDAQSL